MQVVNRFFATRWGPILAGLVIGVVAAFLVQQGNPKNMGLCMGCFASGSWRMRECYVKD